MRVIFDVLRDGLTALNTAKNQMETARSQVSTGKRVVAPSDDPLATQQVIGEYATLGAIDAYRRSADSAAARLAATDSVLNGVVDKLTASISAAMSGRGSNKQPAERAAAAAEVRQLRDALVGDFNTTFRGTYLFSGTRVDVQPYVGTAGVFTYQGDSSTVQVEVDKNRLVTVAYDGRSVAQGTDPVDVFTAMEALAVAIEAGNDPAIGTGIDALEHAFERVGRLQGRLGADERGVDAASARLASMRLTTDARRGKLEDANMAEAIVRMNEADTAYRAALAAVGTANRQSLLDYLK